MDKEYKSKFKIDKSMLDALKFYINPEMYKAEREHEANGGKSAMVRENREFAQHYRSMMAGEGVKVSPAMQKALDAIKERRRKEKEQKNIRVQDISGAEPVDDDDEALG